MIGVGNLNGALGRVRGLYYGWWLAGLGALIMAVGPVPLFSGMTVWNPVLRARMMWSKDQLVWAFALGRIEGGLFGPLEGWLVDNIGPRRMVLFGMLILGTGFVLFSMIQELWHLYAVFVLMTLGAAAGTWMPMMSVVNQWFARHRSTAMAVVMEGFAIGGVIVPLAMAWSIGSVDVLEPERFGWRATAFGIGVLILVLALPISRLVRNKPEEYGLHPDGDPSPAVVRPSSEGSSRGPAPEQVGHTWQQALKTRIFWFMAIGHGCSACVLVTLTVHLGLLLDDRDFSLETIGLVVSAYTGVSAVFVLMGGYIADRFPIRFEVFAFSALQTVAVFVLLAAHTLPMVFLFAVLMGAGFGGRTATSSSIRGVYFGRRAFASITGLSMVPMNVLLLAMPLFAAYVSYDISFVTIALVCLFGSSLYLFLGEPTGVRVEGAAGGPETGGRGVTDGTERPGGLPKAKG